MPVEIMLLPGWSPFHIAKVSYWSRTVLVPLLVLMALRPRARNPHRVTIRELFVEPPESVRDWITGPTSSPLVDALSACSTGCCAGPSRCFRPGRGGGRSTRRSPLSTERLNGEDGLGGIFPAMANSLMMFDCLGYPARPSRLADRRGRDPQASGARRRAQLLPALPVAGVGYRARLSRADGGGRPASSTRRSRQALDWLAEKQVLEVVGDWADDPPRRCGPAAGPSNTRTRIIPMSTTPPPSRWRSTASIGTRYRAAIDRAAEWIVGMQSRNGGWGSFDADNTHYYLNHIPFADHGALLDPPTADVSARCLGLLAQLGDRRGPPRDRRRARLSAARAGSRRQLVRPLGHQLHLRHLVGAGRAQRRRHRSRRRRKSAARSPGCSPGSARMAAGARTRQSYWPGMPAWRGALQHGLADRLGVARPDGRGRGRQPGRRPRRRLSDRKPERRTATWDEPWFTAVGFPRVFFLRYHGYRALFPALGAGPLPASDRRANSARVPFGISSIAARWSTVCSDRRTAIGSRDLRLRARRARLKCARVRLGFAAVSRRRGLA